MPLWVKNPDSLPAQVWSSRLNPTTADTTVTTTTTTTTATTNNNNSDNNDPVEVFYQDGKS